MSMRQSSCAVLTDPFSSTSDSIKVFASEQHQIKLSISVVLLFSWYHCRSVLIKSQGSKY